MILIIDHKCVHVFNVQLVKVQLTVSSAAV